MQDSVFKGALGFPKFKDLKNCPFCGSNTFYVRQHAEGTVIFRFCPDGSEADNEDMYNTVSLTEGINVYCDNCQRFIGNRNTGKLSSGAVKALCDINSKQ